MAKMLLEVKNELFEVLKSYLGQSWLFIYFFIRFDPKYAA